MLIKNYFLFNWRYKKQSLAVVSLSSWHLSFEGIEHKRIFELERYITLKKWGLKTIENKQ